MPLGISNDNFIASATLRYGDQLAKSIQTAGLGIEQSLERVATNRQLQGLGETLSQINPETPEYPKELIKVGAAFPLAMKDPRGQTLMSIGVKSHFQWQNAQQQMQRAQTQFGNQVGLQGIRHQDRMAEINARNTGGDNGVDLVTGLPGNDFPQGGGTTTTLAPQNPATRAGFSFGAGMQDASQIDTPTTEPGVGFSSGNPARSSGFGAGVQPEGEAALPPLPAPDGETNGLMGTGNSPDASDPIIARALGPLREAQRITGVKPTKKEVFGAIAAERRAANQSAMQEDRQANTEVLTQEKMKAAAEKRAADEAAKAEKDAATLAAKEASKQTDLLKLRRVSVDREVAKARAELNKHLVAPEEELAQDKSYFAKKKKLQAELERAGTALAEIDSALQTGGKSKKLKWDDATNSLVPQ